MQTHFRETKAIIDLHAVRNNFQYLQGCLEQGELIPVIKANAYGHGATEIARMLSTSAKSFAVALIEEAIELRQQGIKNTLIILEGNPSIQGFKACFDYNLTPVIHSHNQLNWYEQIQVKQRCECWIKYDIGMHRLGFTDEDITAAWLKLKALSPNSPVLCGHFSSADTPSYPSVVKQLNKFMSVRNTLKCRSSLANSPALVSMPESHVEWNRAGIALYGISPTGKLSERATELAYVMSLYAPVIALRDIPKGDTVGYGDTWKAERDSKIATLAIGYGDGYPRHAPSGTPVMINSQRAPLIGRVSMDMITIDVTDHPLVNIGDMAELWGRHLPVEIVAKQCGTIAYELLTRVGPRVPRQFINIK